MKNNLGTRSNLGNGLRCPHCDAKLTYRSTRTVTPFYKQTNLVCTDIDCLATFGGEISITHGISPGLSPKPDIGIPIRGARTPDAVANDNGSERVSDRFEG